MPNISVDPTASTVTGTSDGDVFNSTAGNGISGSPTLIGGSGDDTYYVTSSKVKIVEQSNGGNDTVISLGNYQLAPNIENLQIWGTGTGIGNDQANTITAGNNCVLDGGKGNDILFGKGTSDVFQFDAGSGADLIPTWNSSDMLRLAGYGQFKTFADVRAAMTQDGANVRLQLDANDFIIIQNTAVSSFTAANVQLSLPTTGMHLTFDDEFNTPLTVGQQGKGLDSAWSMQGQGTNDLGQHTLLGNGEKELYVDPSFKGQGSKALGLNPFSENNGVLSLTASPMPAADKAAAYGYQFQSGAINTASSFSQTYGYFEARMKLPTGSGSWPAFWLLREDGTWPPELDVLEAWNNTTAVQTVHTEQTGSHTMSSSSTWVPDGDSAFHNYGILWTATTLTWYIDGVAVFSQPTPADMHSPMYMAIDNAVSSQNTDPNYTGSLDVDYVRAYSLNSLPAGVGVVTPSAATAAQVGDTVGAPDPVSATATTVSGGGSAGATTSVPATSGGTPTGSATTPASGSASTPAPTTTNAATPAGTTSAAAHSYWGYDANEPDGFNAVYYLAHNPDVAKSGMNPLAHYEKYGKAEGRAAFDPTVTAESAAAAWAADPSQPDGFNALYYLDHNPDVAAAGVDPLTHYQSNGKAEGRLAHGPSDAAATSASTAPATGSSTGGSSTGGSSTGAAASPTPAHAYWGENLDNPDGFNATYYLANNPDVAASGMNPLAHYEEYGKAEGRKPFDPTAVQNTSHAYWGAQTNQPDGFNAAYYLSHNPDVLLSGMDPLTHYEQYGKNEGRLAYDHTAATTSATPAAASIAPAATVATSAGHASFGYVSGEPDGFNAAYYALHNPDVVASGADLLTHYEQAGKSEGRLAYDDGSGRETSVGTAGNDHFVAPAGFDHVFTGGGGNDTFTFGAGVGWDTITDFDPTHDTLDTSALTAKYGAPTISAIPWENGSMIHFAGGETVLLLGVSVADAHHAALG